MLNNMLIISRNVIYKNLENTMKADVLEFDIKTKNTKIYMHDAKEKVVIKNLE
jgi:predicted HTH transcriptional regulator